MKKLFSVFLCLFSLPLLAQTYATIYPIEAHFGYAGGGVNYYAKQWSDASNRMSFAAVQNSKSTALELWPTTGTRPTVDSLGEITLNRYLWSASAMERFNISAMNDNATESAAYRFGVERGGTGVFRPIIFCFEDVTPGVAFCPFKIDTTGTYVNVGGTWKAVAYVP